MSPVTKPIAVIARYPAHSTTLGKLTPGNSGQVLGLSGGGPMVQRLLELGFVSGASVRVVRYAPFGDPMEVELNGCHLAMRRAEADVVEVRPA